MMSSNNQIRVRDKVMSKEHFEGQYLDDNNIYRATMGRIEIHFEDQGRGQSCKAIIPEARLIVTRNKEPIAEGKRRGAKSAEQSPLTKLSPITRIILGRKRKISELRTFSRQINSACSASRKK